MSSTSSTVTPGRTIIPSSSSSSATPRNPIPPSSLPRPFQPPPPPGDKGGIPVTPAVLRSIFASSRTSLEERTVSRVAFFRFAGFLISCLAISLAAAKGRKVKTAATVLGLV
ncbi:hypothetical protein M407DRAFT_20666 [Tulasnella calospora MUT 4182]|uniref:Uncharacterized protein n=1 Tax=Tulasnella calospora MUT 4182 TaxID=1051891 RepID=A0A0C3L8N7_9AGAM|nr:hypothetical protein M407DRAFT_20666 [Tulasnella calospora MUT 4182]